MPINAKGLQLSAGIAVALASCYAAGQSDPASNPADLAERQVIAYVSRLADLHCTESVLQEKLTANGHVEAKEQSRFDYLVMINGGADDFQLNESRIETPGAKRKNLPMLVSAGFSTLLLVFHPYYRDSFELTPAADQVLDGRTVQPIAFAQISGKRTPAALVLRGREYPLELQGTAWIDKHSGQVVRIDATLERDMSDVGLHSLNVHAEYRSTPLGKAGGDLMLPSVAVVDVQTPRQHWRNTHVFENYRAFATEAEQDPNVKVHEQSQDKNSQNQEKSDKSQDDKPKADPEENL